MSEKYSVKGISTHRGPKCAKRGGHREVAREAAEATPCFERVAREHLFREVKRGRDLRHEGRVSLLR